MPVVVTLPSLKEEKGSEDAMPFLGKITVRGSLAKAGLILMPAALCIPCPTIIDGLSNVPVLKFPELIFEGTPLTLLKFSSTPFKRTTVCASPFFSRALSSAIIEMPCM